MQTHQQPPFGDLLQTYRKRQGLTQRQLAHKMGLHHNTVGAWERGDYLPATRGTILELARCLRLDEEEAHQLLDASLIIVTSRWSVPYQRNPFFTARQASLEHLQTLLSGENGSAACALSGLGGVGKTQLALEYAYRSSLTYAAVFWVNASTGEEIHNSFVAIAKTLNLLTCSSQRPEETVELVLKWLNIHRDWLLLFDHVQDQMLMLPFVPSSPHGALLFTTRLPTLGTLAPCLELLPLSVEESVHLLLSRTMAPSFPLSSTQLSGEEEQAARAIAEALGGLPLALEQAAAYMEESHCGFTEFWSLLQGHTLQVLQKHPVSMAYPCSVEQTFMLAFENLQRQNPAAAEMLTLCCFLAPDEIPEILLSVGATFLPEPLQAALSDPLRLQTTFQDLLTYALLHRNAQARTFRVHRLVQTVLKAHVSKPVQQAWVQRLICLLDQLFLVKLSRLETERWTWYERLLPHILSVLQKHERFHLAFRELGSLLQKTAIYLFQRQRYSQAEEFHHRALRVQEQVLGENHPEVAITLASLAKTLESGMHYQHVEPLYQRAIAVLEAQRGVEDARLVFPLQALASFWASMGRYQEAEVLYQRAMRICQEQESPDQLEMATVLHQLAICTSSQGKYAQAEKLYLQALEILEQFLPSSHPDIATSLNDLANLYFRRANYEQAEQLFLRCLSLYRETVGTERTEVATTLGNLAWLYQRQGYYEVAERLYQRNLALCEQVVGPENLLVAHTLTHLAALYSFWGRYEEAEGLAKRAFSIYERNLPSDHQAISYPLYTLALVACAQEKYEQANVFSSHALMLREQKLPAMHVALAYSLHQQGYILQMQGKIDQAEQLYQRALVVYQKTLGPDHLDVALLENKIATLFQSQGRYEEAEQHYRKALCLWEHFREFHHPSHIACLERYASLLKQQQRGAEYDRYRLRIQEMQARRQERSKTLMQGLPVLMETTTNREASHIDDDGRSDVLERFLQECCASSHWPILLMSSIQFLSNGLMLKRNGGSGSSSSLPLPQSVMILQPFLETRIKNIQGY